VISRGVGGLITVSEPCLGGVDTREVRDTEWQNRWLARDPWNWDEDYDTVVKSGKGSYDVVG
jgi:hypothetical protein